ncbi:MAG TPA: hypothetical protein VFR78_15420 [Pyrinomonadaceae bacterium]|nr:hypothetical protein [Pyrinomonadaceae bacterium]
MVEYVLQGANDPRVIKPASDELFDNEGHGSRRKQTRSVLTKPFSTFSIGT